MRAGSHARRRRLGREARRHRKAAAQRLRHRHDIGRDARPLMREQLARPPHARLHLVEDQQQPVFVADLAQRPQFRRLDDPHAAFALDGLDQDAGRLRPDRLAHRLEVAERDLIEAIDLGAEAIEIFLLSACGDRRQRAAVESPFKRDQPVFLGLAARRVVLARHLDRALDRLGAGIREEDRVGECQLDQSLRQLLLFRHAVEIGGVPQLVRLRRQRLDQHRMRMTQGVNRDAGAQVQVAPPLRVHDMGSLSPLEGNGRTGIGGKNGTDHARPHDGGWFQRRGS